MELKIENAHQREVTRERIDFLQSLIDDLKANPPDFEVVHPLLYEAQINGWQSLLDEMREDCNAYDAAQIGKE